MTLKFLEKPVADASSWLDEGGYHRGDDLGSGSTGLLALILYVNSDVAGREVHNCLSLLLLIVTLGQKWRVKGEEGVGQRRCVWAKVSVKPK
jgi:hypothetical protein